MGGLSALPVIDITRLVATEDAADVATQIRDACRQNGFFYVVGHGISNALQQRLETLSREFFAQDHESKMAVRMERGGRAWRGYFPVGSELTSGKPDQKEGLYFGSELSEEHPMVAAGVPMFGANLFPELAGFRETLLEYLDAMTELGHHLMSGISLSLDLPVDYFRQQYTDDPLILFRIFHYPALPAADYKTSWSVGEHTDYGLLTILRQDHNGGLQVKTRQQWIDAPPIEGSFVCNIGDMLDRMTSGLYRSTPHRVKNTSGCGRLSFPFFFDPNFDAVVHPVNPGQAVSDDKQDRWDQASVHEFGGTYGEYILGKVGKVFPELREKNL